MDIEYRKTTKFFDVKTLVSNAEGFFYSSLYPIFLAVCAVICYITALPFLGVTIVFLIGSYLLITTRDATPIIPLPLYFMFFLRNLDVTGSLTFYLMIIPVGVCLIIHFIRFPLERFNFGKLFLPLVLVSGALFMGGVLSPYVSAYAKGLLYTIPLGVVVLVVYLYFANYVAYPDDFDVKKYFATIIVMMGFMATAELFYYEYHLSVLNSNVFERSEIGWTNVNTIASIILLSIPCACYLAAKSELIYPHILIVFMLYVALYITSSEGSFGIAGVFLPILAFFVYKRANNQNKRRFNLFIFIGICSILLLLIGLEATDKMDKLTDLIDKFLNSGDSGRTGLYKDAWRIFNDYPVFGAGFGYFNDYVYSTSTSSQLRLFNFHSTFFQVIGSMGLFGLVVYVYYFYARISILTERNSTFNLFAFFSFLLYSSYGFIDTVEFATIPGVLTITMIVLITEFSNSQERPFKSPLINKVDY